MKGSLKIIKKKKNKQATCSFVKMHKNVFSSGAQVLGLLWAIGVLATSAPVPVTASPLGTSRFCHRGTNTPVDSHQLFAFILMFMFAFLLS